MVSVKGKTIALVGADDETIVEAAKQGILYGPYNNYFSEFGVSALWNGYVLPTATKLAQPFRSGAVSVGDHSVVSQPPDNLVGPVSEFVFLQKGAAASSLSSEEARNR